jgi:hypothetical protein
MACTWDIKQVFQSPAQSRKAGVEAGEVEDGKLDLGKIRSSLYSYCFSEKARLPCNSLVRGHPRALLRPCLAVHCPPCQAV